MIYRLNKYQIISLIVTLVVIFFIIWNVITSKRKDNTNHSTPFVITSDSLNRQIKKQQKLILYTDSCNELLIQQIDSLKKILVIKQNEIKLLNKKRDYAKDIDYSKLTNNDINRYLSKRYTIK